MLQRKLPFFGLNVLCGLVARQVRSKRVLWQLAPLTSAAAARLHNVCWCKTRKKRCPSPTSYLSDRGTPQASVKNIPSLLSSTAERRRTFHTSAPQGMNRRVKAQVKARVSDFILQHEEYRSCFSDNTPLSALIKEYVVYVKAPTQRVVENVTWSSSLSGVTNVQRVASFFATVCTKRCS